MVCCSVTKGREGVIKTPASFQSVLTRSKVGKRPASWVRGVGSPCALVCFGCCNRTPQTQWPMNNKMLSLPVLEAGKPNIKSPADSLPPWEKMEKSNYIYYWWEAGKGLLLLVKIKTHSAVLATFIQIRICILKSYNI